MEKVIIYRERKAWQLHIDLYMEYATKTETDKYIKYGSECRIIAFWNFEYNRGYVSGTRQLTRLWDNLLDYGRVKRALDDTPLRDRR